MTYEAWRISYQSSEQAARSAYAEIKRLTVENAKGQDIALTLLAERDALAAQVVAMREGVEQYLEENNPEGFGCACEPNHTCGPCSAYKRQKVLRDAIDTSQAEAIFRERDAMTLFESAKHFDKDPLILSAHYKVAQHLRRMAEEKRSGK